MKEVITSIKNFNFKKINNKQGNCIIYFYCLLCSIIFLSICSKNSPLYPFNNWDDPNSFFTMGKGMANGLIIYKDLFEQKGPILYFLHAIAYFISNNTFLGIFIFEIFSFSVFLYFMNKIVMLYCKKIHFLWATPIISYIILTSYVFIAGDSAEEFCLPLLAISLYYMLNYYKNIYPNKMPTRQIFLNGIIAGCVLCIKYNLLGFWLGLAAFICIGLLINQKIKEAFLTGIYFLAGMSIPVIPWVIYFGIHNALYDVFNVYFLINISSYSTHSSILERIFTALKDASMYAKNLWLFSLITFIGYFYIIFTKNILKHKYAKIALTITILISVIGVYFGANHIYYFLILMPFIILGILWIAKMLEKFKKFNYKKLIITISPVFLLLVIFLTCSTSSNFEFRKTKKEDLVQYQFAEIINQKENATLLNYGFLDGGFYTVTNITPNTKYFHKPNIAYENFPEIMDEQNRYIKETLIDFVVIKVDTQEDSFSIPYLYENYEKIKTVYSNDINQYYMLFQVKD